MGVVVVGSIIVPFGIGCACSVWWLDINDEGNGPDWVTPDFVAFVLFAGASLSFTALPLLSAILKASQLVKSEFGTFVRRQPHHTLLPMSSWFLSAFTMIIF